MRFPRSTFPALFLLVGSMPQAKQPVAFFGLTPGEDPLLSSFFAERVYRALATDSALAPVPSQPWKPWVLETSSPRKVWRVEDYRGLSKQAGAAYFVLAYREPFRFASSRIWWKPWGSEQSWSWPRRCLCRLSSRRQIVWSRSVRRWRPTRTCQGQVERDTLSFRALRRPVSGFSFKRFGRGHILSVSAPSSPIYPSWISCSTAMKTACAFCAKGG